MGYQSSESKAEISPLDFEIDSKFLVLDMFII